MGASSHAVIPHDRRAVVLLSGGLDSATTLASAVAEGYRCYALSFNYGQRHHCELRAAATVAVQLGAVEHRQVALDLSQFGGSALTDPAIAVPAAGGGGIPMTYVPARNTVFLALALAWAEVLHAEAIFIGVNAVDYSGYPDCRPDYIAAVQTLINCATRTTVEGGTITLQTPLLHLTKADIIRLGSRLGVDFATTISCYNPNAVGQACGCCDACFLRREGFIAAGVADVTRYQ